MAWNRTERKHTHSCTVHITMVGGDAVVAGAEFSAGAAASRGLNALSPAATAAG